MLRLSRPTEGPLMKSQKFATTSRRWSMPLFLIRNKCSYFVQFTSKWGMVAHKWINKAAMNFECWDIQKPGDEVEDALVPGSVSSRRGWSWKEKFKSGQCITCTSIRIPSRIHIWWSKIREIQQPEWWTQAGTRSLYSGSEATSWISRSMKLRLRRWAPGIKLLHNIRHILKLYGYIRRHTRLVDVTQDLPTSVLATSLLVIHDTRTGRLTSIKSKTTS